MDKYDLEQLAQKGKEKINISRTRINRKLEDLSFPAVFSKQLAIHCGAAILCVILLCVILSGIINLNCRNDMTDLVTDAAMEIINIKNQDFSLSQDAAHLNKNMQETIRTANDNGFISDSVCVLYNLTEQKIERYSSFNIESNSDRLNEWYQEQTGDANAEPIFAIPHSLREFIDKYEGKNFVITSAHLINYVVTPEVVEVRSGRRVIDTWSETEGLNPSRAILTAECPVFIAGVKEDNVLLNVITSHYFDSNNKNNPVQYDKTEWPNKIHIATKQFAVDNIDYEISLIYQSAGLGPIMWFIVLASITIVGVAVIVSLTQTKKIRNL